jgi:hypothetical protein
MPFFAEPFLKKSAENYSYFKIVKFQIDFYTYVVEGKCDGVVLQWKLNTVHHSLLLPWAKSKYYNLFCCRFGAATAGNSYYSARGGF